MKSLKNYKNPLTSNKGFTLVELTVAMAFFSFMMAILSIGVLQIMRMYQAGVSSRRTQQAARIAIEDITRETRAAGRIAEATEGRLCLEGAQVVDFQRVDNSLIKTVGGGSCENIGSPRETTMIDGDSADASVQFREFFVNPIYYLATDTEPVSVRVKITVTTGQVQEDEAFCRPGAGSEFCSTTSYTNVISLRGLEL